MLSFYTPWKYKKTFSYGLKYFEQHIITSIQN